MEFIWKMNKEDWLKLNNNMDNDLGEMYGQLYVGDYCIEFFESGWTNIYQLHVDDGYGYDKNGIPYSLTDLYIDVPIANTFDEFKNLCERRFAAGIGTYFSLKYANKKCEWYDVVNCCTQ